MKTIGLLGGMSWQSTQTYYRLINEGVHARLGGLHSADLLLASIDFAPLEKLQVAGDWLAAGAVLANKARALEAAGAEGLMICTNTMHKVADQVASSVDIPLLHIADATGDYLVAQGVQTAALLGTSFTMEQGFYTDRLREKFSLEVLTPEQTSREYVHRVIYQELCVGIISDESRSRYLDLMARLGAAGAEVIILGCTEIGLLVTQADTDMRLVDTTVLHAQAAVRFMLDGGDSNPP